MSEGLTTALIVTAAAGVAPIIYMLISRIVTGFSRKRVSAALAGFAVGYQTAKKDVVYPLEKRQELEGEAIRAVLEFEENGETYRCVSRGEYEKAAFDRMFSSDNNELLCKKKAPGSDVIIVKEYSRRRRRTALAFLTLAFLASAIELTAAVYMGKI